MPRARLQIEKYVISLGGSLIVPDRIDTDFMKGFARLILSEIKKGRLFFIITGGGATARGYITALRQFGRSTNNDLDWIGISATKMNAQFLSAIFGNQVRKKIITDPSVKKTGLKNINLVCGWKPGSSTDYVAVKIAQTYGVGEIINLSNIDYVYNKDPKKYKKAKRYKEMSWAEFAKLFGTKWDPGANVPFDPVAAALAHKLGLKVVVMNGRKLGKVKEYLNRRRFTGTVIS